MPLAWVALKATLCIGMQAPTDTGEDFGFGSGVVGRQRRSIKSVRDRNDLVISAVARRRAFLYLPGRKNALTVKWIDIGAGIEHHLVGHR